jgi:hypothetical protein
MADVDRTYADAVESLRRCCSGYSSAAMIRRRRRKFCESQRCGATRIHMGCWFQGAVPPARNVAPPRR